jgi:hypothetical protein
MKTSNKLLVGLLILMLLTITVFAGVARYHYNTDRVSGDGNSVSQAREVSKFSGVRVKGKIKLYLTQGTGTRLEIKADQNLMPLISTKVEDGILTIDADHTIDRNAVLEARLTTDAISSLEMSEEAVVETTNELKGEELRLAGSSGSSGSIALQYTNLSGDFSSGANIKLSGNVEKATLETSAGARMEGGNLTAKKCAVNGSAGSFATIQVTEELTADVNSGSVLQYSGNPSVKSINATSGGAIQRK